MNIHTHKHRENNKIYTETQVVNVIEQRWYLLITLWFILYSIFFFIFYEKKKKIISSGVCLWRESKRKNKKPTCFSEMVVTSLYDAKFRVKLQLLGDLSNTRRVTTRWRAFNPLINVALEGSRFRILVSSKIFKEKRTEHTKI